ncbi:Alternative oxidase [Picochlorum sp. SENEW3]|nr:Alternative oxidase [Picochlorum sp. SENEW3]
MRKSALTSIVAQASRLGCFGGIGGALPAVGGSSQQMISRVDGALSGPTSLFSSNDYSSYSLGMMFNQSYGGVGGKGSTTLTRGVKEGHVARRAISTQGGAQDAGLPKEESSERSTSQERVMPHPGMHVETGAEGEEKNFTTQDGSYWLMQPVYDKEYLLSITPKHRKPQSFHDYTGYYGVSLLRKTFDLITGYGPNMTHSKWMTRFLFLETVAGVPGMVGAMLRHLRSLRTMKRDNGWIHTLLEEAENERMHLLTFMQMKNPGLFFRGSVIFTQGVFLSLYSLFYAVSPRHCHAFVSYLEEEAVKTYTHAIDDFDSGKIPEWKNMKAPFIAQKYWRLDEDASMKDLLLAIRADEACHNHVNAVFAEMHANDPNPFAPGTTIIQ